MNPEEYVDRLIEQRERRAKQLPVLTDEVAASLAAAAVLTQLRELTVPPAFASYLELYLRARARSFGQHACTALPVVRPVRRAGVRRSWTAVLGFAAVLLAACISILTASARSLPGDTLYGLKQAEYQFTLNFASGPQDRASAQIDQLRNALVDLRTVVTAGRAGDAILHELHSAMQQVRKATEIISHLRTFGHAASVSREPVGITQVIRRALSLMQEQLRLRQIEVHLQLPEEEVLVLGNAIQLEQVFINLLTNARDAIANAERKSIAITCTRQAHSVDIRVCDTGPGIPAGLEQRIFDPFFTTKEVGAGTGLGLSITYGSIKEHQGTIAVENRPDEGTRFLIQLPLEP